MPLNPSSNTAKNPCTNVQFTKKHNKRTLEHSEDQEDSSNSPKKKFVTITDQNLLNDGDDLNSDETFNPKILSESIQNSDSRNINGKKDSDKSSLKVTIRRMSQNNVKSQINTNENFDLLNHQYQCQNPSQHEFSKVKDASVSTTTSATFTEPDLLGPCEPGTKIVLDATVWLETPGMLVVNANWRGKCYLGTLIDVSKSSLGPNCPDKSISALSFMKNRAWRGSGPKTRGFPRNSNRFSHLQRDLIESSNNKAGITTRSAKAAAMAAASKNQDSQGVSSESEMSTSSSVTTSNKRIQEDGDVKLSLKRRSKRCRNKNALTLSEKNDNPNKDSTSKPTGINDQYTEQNSANIYCSINNGNGNNINNNNDEKTAEETPIKPVFPCPHENCNKEFPSQISLRFHLQLGHSRVKKETDTKIRNSKKKSTKLNEYEFDENDAPPQLQEEIPIEDPKDLSFFSNSKQNGKNEKLISTNYETKSDYIPMPTASPAYSDISDDDLQETTLEQNGKKSINESCVPNKEELNLETSLSKQQIPNHFPKNLTSLGQFTNLHLESQSFIQEKSDSKFISNQSNSIAQFSYDTLDQKNCSQ